MWYLTIPRLLYMHNSSTVASTLLWFYMFRQLKITTFETYNTSVLLTSVVTYNELCCSIELNNKTESQYKVTFCLLRPTLLFSEQKIVCLFLVIVIQQNNRFVEKSRSVNRLKTDINISNRHEIRITS